MNFVNKIKEDLDKLSINEQIDIDYSSAKLCIIDINNGFAREGALYSPRVEKNIKDTAYLAKSWLDKGGEVIAYTDCHPKDAKEFNSYPPHCIFGTEEAELVDELKILKESGLKEIKKNSTNGILAYNPANDKVRRDYFILGCVTDICIYQFATTLRAYLNEHNLSGDVYIIKDLVDTFDFIDSHPADFYNAVFLKSLVDNGVKLISNSMFIEKCNNL